MAAPLLRWPTVGAWQPARPKELAANAAPTIHSLTSTCHWAWHSVISGTPGARAQVSQSGYQAAAHYWPEVFGGVSAATRLRVLQDMACVRPVLVRGAESMVMVNSPCMSGQPVPAGLPRSEAAQERG